MDVMPQIEVIKRLLIVSLLAGLVGFERERHGRAAGLRTHLLVGVGSCLMMLTALDMMEQLAGRVQIDPTRMASQVISGIGFLGAGAILRFRASIRGLTTAASIWTVAGIGLAVGAGFYLGAVATTVIVLIALFWFGAIERGMRKDWYKTLVVETGGTAQDLARIREVLTAHSVEIRDFDIRPTGEPQVSVVEMHLRLLSERDEEPMLSELAALSGTRRARWV